MFGKNMEPGPVRVAITVQHHLPSQPQHLSSLHVPDAHMALHSCLKSKRLVICADHAVYCLTELHFSRVRRLYCTESSKQSLGCKARIVIYIFTRTVCLACIDDVKDTSQLHRSHPPFYNLLLHLFFLLIFSGVALVIQWLSQPYTQLSACAMHLMPSFSTQTKA